MLKIFLIFLYLIMFSVMNTNASGKVLYYNNRFDYIYNEAENFLKNGDYEEAKKRVYLYLDKTHFKSCDGIKLLVDFNNILKLKNKEIYEIIYNSCVIYKSGDYKSSLKELENIKIDDYKDDILLVNIFFINYNSNIEAINHNSYNKEVLSYLTGNTFLSQDFPLTYGLWLANIYFEAKQIDLYNTTYNKYLLNNDYLYKIIYDYYFIELNGKAKIQNLLNLLEYENFYSRNETEEQFNIHKSIYKLLFQKYIEISDTNNIVKYLFLFNDVDVKFRKLYSKEILNYFLQVKDISIYKKAIINNIAEISYHKDDIEAKKISIEERLSTYYDFISSFLFLYQFNKEDNILNGSFKYSTITKSLNTLLYRYNSLISSNNIDMNIDPYIKEELIKSTKKLILLHENGEINILNDLSGILKTIIKDIPELKEYSSYDFTINKKIISISSNSIYYIINKYLILILVSIILFILFVFIRKKG